MTHPTNEGATKYSQMASTAERRALFIQSALDMVLDHGFDGLDLDWEYPGTYVENVVVVFPQAPFRATNVPRPTLVSSNCATAPWLSEECRR